MKRSCSAITVSSRSLSARHASTATCAAEIVVMQVTRLATAADRIFPSSGELLRPLGVLIMSDISPFFILSSKFGRPSAIFGTSVTGMP